MSNTENPLDSRRISIAFVLAGIIVLGALTFTNASPPTPPSFQTGIAQCSTTSPNLPEGFGCAGTITFPKAFASGPTAYGITIVCWANALQNLAGKTNASDVCNNLGIQTAHMVDSGTTFKIYTIITGPTTWTNMPAAATPFLGSDAYDVQFNQPNAYAADLTLQIAGICENPSSGTNAKLGLQFSADFSTWTDLGPNFYVGVGTGSSNFCPFATPAAPFPFQSNQSNIILPLSATTGNLRIFGQQGSGVGDLPQFSQLQIQLGTISTFNPVAHIGFPQGDNSRFVHTTSMPFYMLMSYPAGTYVPIMQWWACVC